ncbi:hypothetical protein ES703_118681 [subsurface metagenome]
MAGNEQQGIALPVRAPYTAPDLIELGQAKPVGIVNDNGVYIGQINPGFDNTGT